MFLRNTVRYSFSRGPVIYRRNLLYFTRSMETYASTPLYLYNRILTNQFILHQVYERTLKSNAKVRTFVHM